MSWEVQTAAWKKMRDHQGLSHLVGSRIFKFAPQDASYPLIEFGPDEDVSAAADCLSLYQTSLTVLVWSLIDEGDGARGQAQSQKICRAVRDCLHGEDLLIEGCERTALEWQSTRVEQSDDGKAWFGTIIFTGLIEEI